MKQSDEIWRPVPTFEDLYEVSSHGRVRSLDRIVDRSDGTTAHYKGRVLTPNTSGRYLRVLLHGRDGREEQKSVHRLVAKTFISNPKDKPEVNHIDNDPTNNHVSNLEWVTRGENVSHAIQHGYAENPRFPGEANPKAKLTKAEAKEIRERVDEERQVLAHDYGVSISTISRIWAGDLWGFDEHIGPTKNGESNPKSKLDAEDVRQIRFRYEKEDITQSELADEYDTTQGNVGLIVRGETWAHIK
jgi:DNA-binding transcriptional regulator YiaG